MPQPLKELLDFSRSSPDQAWERLLAQKEAIAAEAGNPEFKRWLDLLRRAYAARRFADSCPMVARSNCRPLDVLRAHRVAEVGVTAMAQAGDFAGAVALWASMERADVDLVVTSRSMVMHLVALSRLDSATRLVAVLLVGASQADPPLDLGVRASLRDAISSAFDPVTKDSFDLTTAVRSEYVYQRKRLEVVWGAVESGPTEPRDFFAPTFLSKALFDRGATIRLLNQRFEPLATLEPGSAAPA